MKRSHIKLYKFFFIIFYILLPSDGFAYIGLGAFLPILGNILWVILFALISLLGILFYPITVIYKKYSKKRKKNEKRF